jgi:hypothetical protein
MSTEQRRRSCSIDELMDDEPISEQQHEPADESRTRSAFEPRTESRNARHIREIEERDAQWAAETEAEHARQQRDERERAIAVNAAAVQRITDLESEVLQLAEACNALADALEHELAHVTRENIELKEKQVQLESALAALQLTLATERGKAIDLPNPLRSVN